MYWKVLNLFRLIVNVSGVLANIELTLIINIMLFKNHAFLVYK